MEEERAHRLAEKETEERLAEERRKREAQQRRPITIEFDDRGVCHLHLLGLAPAGYLAAPGNGA
jgi:hypothetical protein